MLTPIVSCRVGDDLLGRVVVAALLLVAALPAVSQVLAVDDGTPESAISAQNNEHLFAWMNVLSPPAELCDDYQIEAVQIMWEQYLTLGDSVSAYVYEDTDDDLSPVTGARLLAEVPNVRVTHNDGTTLSEYALAEPVTIGECRNVIVAFVNTGTRGRQSDGDPAAVDTSSFAGRSWLTRPVETLQLPPDLSSEALFTIFDGFDGTFDGNFLIRAVASAVVTSNGEAQRVRFELGVPSPNPARDVTRVAFTLSHAGTVRAQVRTLDGRVVRSVEQSHAAGEGELSVDVSGLAAGVYLLVTQTHDGTSARQVVVAR